MLLLLGSFYKPLGRIYILETIAVSEKTLTPISQLVLTTQEIQIVLNHQSAEQEEGFQVLQMEVVLETWLDFLRQGLSLTGLGIAADQRMT